jgi:hypothetical protein
MQDPFAAPTEAQDEVVAPAAVEAPASAPAPRPASTSEGKLVVTLKGGTGFDAPWIVIHADDAADALSQFDNTLASLMEKAQHAAKHFGSLGSPSGGGRPAAAGQPAGSTEAPPWAPPKPFDDFVYKTGVSAKNGKVWHAWMPPQKGDARPAKFFYND